MGCGRLDAAHDFAPWRSWNAWTDDVPQSGTPWHIRVGSFRDLRISTYWSSRMPSPGTGLRTLRSCSLGIEDPANKRRSGTDFVSADDTYLVSVLLIPCSLKPEVLLALSQVMCCQTCHGGQEVAKQRGCGALTAGSPWRPTPKAFSLRKTGYCAATWEWIESNTYTRIIIHNGEGTAGQQCP